MSCNTCCFFCTFLSCKSSRSFYSFLLCSSCRQLHFFEAKLTILTHDVFCDNQKYFSVGQYPFLIFNIFICGWTNFLMKETTFVERHPLYTTIAVMNIVTGLRKTAKTVAYIFTVGNNLTSSSTCAWFCSLLSVYSIYCISNHITYL